MNKSSLLRGIFWIVLAASFAGLVLASYAIYTRQVDKIEILKKNLEETHQLLKDTKDQLTEVKNNTSILSETKKNLSKKVSLQEGRIKQFQQQKETLEDKTRGLSAQKRKLEAALEETRKSLEDRIRIKELKIAELERDFQKKSAMEKAMFLADEEKSKEQGLAAEVLLEALIKRNEELANKANKSKQQLVRLIEKNKAGTGDRQENAKGESDLRKKISDLNMMINQNKKLIAENKKTIRDVTSEKERIANQLQQTQDQFNEEALRLHYNLGLAYDESRQYKEALAEYKKALEITQLDANLHYNMAIIYHEHLDDLAKAIKHYNTYLELSPNAEDTAKVLHWIEQAKNELKYSNK